MIYSTKTNLTYAYRLLLCIKPLHEKESCTDGYALESHGPTELIANETSVTILVIL